MTADRKLHPLPSPALREKRALPVEVYTPEEVAEILRASRGYVYELLASKRLRSVKLGRLRRIPIEAVRELIASLEEES